MKGRKKVLMSLDLLPNVNEQQLLNKITGLMEENRRKTLKNTLKEIVTERFLTFLFEKNNISDDLKVGNVTNEIVRLLLNDLKSFQFYVDGSLPIEKAFVTGGGVCTTEIVPSTMESKLMDRLYFCGEILNIHGYTGGYNITSALVTGRIAGTYASYNRY